MLCSELLAGYLFKERRVFVLSSWLVSVDIVFIWKSSRNCRRGFNASRTP